MSHRSGLPRHDASWTLDLDGKKPLPGPTVHNLRNLPFTAEPRTKYQYCNLMFVTLTHVVETITGKWLGDVLRETIWKPLGMDSTFLTVSDAREAGGHIAMGYYWHEKDLQHRAIPNDTIQLSSGAGGIVTNVHDYAKWLQCLMGQTAPFSSDVHADIRAPRFVTSSSPLPDLATDVELYSLGWTRTLLYGHVVYRHSGGTASINTNLYWFPDLNYGLVAFGNVAMRAFGAEEVIFHRLIQDKLSLSPEQRINATEPYVHPFFHMYVLTGRLWKQIVDEPSAAMANAVSILYPDLPDPPLPATLSADELQGTYVSSGYGALHFTARPDPRDASAPAVLVAYKDETIFPMTCILRHASGDFWGAVPYRRGDGPRGVAGAVVVCGRRIQDWPGGKSAAAGRRMAKGQ